MFKVVQAIKNVQLSANSLILLIATYVSCLFNLPFLSKTLTATQALPEYNIAFLLSVPLLLICVITVFISVFSWPRLLKPFCVLLILLSCLLFYGTQTYGIIFDYGMVQNTVETDAAEAFSYFNTYALLFFVVLGVLPAVAVCGVKIIVNKPLAEVATRGKLVFLSLVTIAVIGYSFYSDYASIGRNNRQLVKYITPFKFIDSAYKYAHKNYFSSPMAFETLDTKPQLMTPSNDQKNVLVLVVGETARAMSFSYNGYEKNTNPYTTDDGVISFTNMFSCGTATAVSVPCMFSHLTKDNFDKNTALNQQNILDIAQQSGVDVFWIENDGGCKDVCNHVAFARISTDISNKLCDGDHCFDEVLIDALTEKLRQINHQTTLIVLHMMGSHGPTYYQRYPEKYRQFTPDCPRSDIQNCSQVELQNTYDNTIAYTDLVLSKIIDELGKLSLSDTTIDTSMLYVSDHGESLGENGLYLHGLPYAFAPEEQTHIPMLYWQNNQQQSISSSCLSSHVNERYDHDNIFHSVLGLLNVNSSAYDNKLDIFATCNTASEIRLALANHTATFLNSAATTTNKINVIN